MQRSVQSRAALLLAALLVSSTASADTRVIFSDDFEKHAAGAKLSDVKPVVGGGYVDPGHTSIAATSALQPPPDGVAVGERCAKCIDNGARLTLTEVDVAAVRGKVVRFRFDLYVTAAGGGGPDIQTFGAGGPESGRAFNLLLNGDGSAAYYAGGKTRTMKDRFPTGQWVPVELLADYQRRVFRAKVGKLAFPGRFDKQVDGFSQIYFGKHGEAAYYCDNVVVEIVPELAKELEAVATALPADEADVVLEGGISPFDVGTAAQLFVDRVLVRDSERVWFSQHRGRKHPDNPVLKPELPWEGWRAEIFGNVIYDADEKRFKMWYLPEEGPRREWFDDPNVTCYAVSADGVHWEKPLVGTLKSKNGRPHNAVAHIHQASVLKDPRDPDPARRYKCIGWSSEPQGYNTFVSPDGLNWTLASATPIAPGGDVLTGFWDAGRELYVAFPKIHPQTRGHVRRQFATIFSRDFREWSAPVHSFTVDLRDDAGSFARLEQVRPILDRPDDPALMRTEYYGIGAYTAESCTLAFPWILTINNNARYGNHEGPQEIQLAVSRDLLNWERPFRTPVIEIGQLDQWDASYHTTAATALRVGDEVWLYYSGANYTHGTPVVYREKFEDGTPTGRKTRFSAAIGLVTWPLDRFVSADAGSEEGTLTTVPLRFAGDRLEVNAAVAPGGKIVVELLDGAGRAPAGLPPSDPLTGDNLRHPVTFAGRLDVSAWKNKPVCLRFRIRQAELYSFAFRGGQAR